MRNLEWRWPVRVKYFSGGGQWTLNLGLMLLGPQISNTNFIEIEQLICRSRVNFVLNHFSVSGVKLQKWLYTDPPLLLWYGKVKKGALGANQACNNQFWVFWLHKRASTTHSRPQLVTWHRLVMYRIHVHKAPFTHHQLGAYGLAYFVLAIKHWWDLDINK